MDLFLVDSSVLIASFRESEHDHKKAVQFLKTLEKFIITDYVLLEVATVLQIRESLSIATKAITLLTQNAHVTVSRLTDEELVETTAFFLTQKQKISFVDASLIVVAKNRQLTLATLDKNLAKAADDLR